LYHHFLEPICQYSGHSHETGYSKISISHDDRYLFSGCIKNVGIIWLTDFPYNENPMFEIEKFEGEVFDTELSTSDWCADPTSTKVSFLLFIFIYFIHWYL